MDFGDRFKEWSASTRTNRVLGYLLLLVALAFFAWLVFQVLSLSARMEKASNTINSQEQSIAASNKDRIELRDTVNAQSEAITKANNELTKLGKSPVVVPDVPTPIPGPQGLPGQNATQAMVEQAVITVCAAAPDDCRGPKGDQGVTGAKGDKGDQGAQGLPGEQGAQGETGATGAQGEKGDPGPAGADGTNGKDAFPFTFSFVIDGVGQTKTYSCTIADPSTPVTCTEVTQPPAG